MAAVYRHMGTDPCPCKLLVNVIWCRGCQCRTLELPQSTILEPWSCQSSISTVNPTICVKRIVLNLVGRRAKLFVQDNKTKEAIKDLMMCLEDVDGAPKLREEASSLLTALQIGDSEQVENVTSETSGYGGYGGY